MGNIWALKLPQYFDKWKVPYILKDGWQTRSRQSGGFNSVKGIGIHHDAGSTNSTPSNDYQWSCFNCPDKPVGNGSLSRDGVFQLWAAGAANTMGKGAPLYTQRGTIAKDDGNANMFAIEASNNGVGEPWTQAQITNYPLLCAAVMDWATHESPGVPLMVGDIFSHWEYVYPTCPGRKIDPAGPSPWLPAPHNAPTSSSWDMDKFRASVWQLMYKPTYPHIETDSEGNPMIIFGFTSYTNTFLPSGVALTPEAYTALINSGYKLVVSASQDQNIKSLLHLSGLTMADMTPK